MARFFYPEYTMRYVENYEAYVTKYTIGNFVYDRIWMIL
jgi:hypothetical protein